MKKNIKLSFHYYMSTNLLISWMQPIIVSLPSLSDKQFPPSEIRMTESVYRTTRHSKQSLFVIFPEQTTRQSNFQRFSLLLREPLKQNGAPLFCFEVGGWGFSERNGKSF